MNRTRRCRNPHLMISPGALIFVAMLAFNLFGDGLRDAVDPRHRPVV